MASGDDPFADYLNTMGLQGMIGNNPYLQYQGQIPMAGYQGAPTDATGQPIQSYTDANNAAQTKYQQQLAAFNAQPQGTTLNSTPNAQWQATQQAIGQGQMGITSQMAAAGIGSQAQAQPIRQAIYAGASAPTAQSAAPTPPSPPDMRQAYLTALANPGPTPTYGAQVVPGAKPTGAPQPSVLQAFLSQHPSGGTSIPGGYSNQSFFNTLNKLQSQGATT